MAKLYLAPVLDCYDGTIRGFKMDTTKMTVAEVKTVIFRYIHYYNLRRIYSTNNGWPPAVYRQMYYESLMAA